MNSTEKSKRYDRIQHERYLGQFRRNPRRFGPQLVATGLNSATERHPQVILDPVVELNPSSPNFGKLKFVVGAMPPNWLL